MNNFNILVGTIENEISNHYNHLDHIEDEGILDLFVELMDLIEMLMLKIKSEGYCIGKNSLDIFQELVETYSGSDCDLWTLLVPYCETLKGWRAEETKEQHRNNVELFKLFLPLKIEKLKKSIESLDLLPSIEEMDVEIKKYDGKEERLPLREIYSIL